MNGGLSPANPTLQEAFKATLLNQGVLVLLIFVTLAITWVACRELLPAPARARLYARSAAGPAEPAGRRLLRIGFGVLWILDGILQAQPAMPAGLPSQVIGPAAAGSPGWVLHLVNWAATGWSFHPIQAAASVVWIQLGIGAWLIACGSGRWSRLAGLASAGWGLVVWVFGEALGGLLAPGPSVLFGAPGAALVYCAAGALLALPERSWHDRRLGRRTLQVTGGCLAALAVLQAWPGRGFWQGRPGGRPGALASMVQSMATARQPAVLARLVGGFGSLVTAHGFGVNLAVVLILAAAAAGLLTGRLAVIRPAAAVLIGFFLADWVLVQDLGFLGGLGTDPNSMVPLTLLVLSAFLAMTRLPAPGTSPVLVPVPKPATIPALDPAALAADISPRRGRQRGAARGAALAATVGTASASVVVALWAGGVMALGAAPMALAEATRTADPIIATAVSGSAATLDTRAAAFSLTDTGGGRVTLASLRGKVVLLTFLDPVAAFDCPLIAQEFRAADELLGSRASHVALVAIVANPLYRSLAYTRAFDRQEQLTGLPNWLFLTGSVAQLGKAWHGYAVSAHVRGAGSMVAHPDVAYVIDPRGMAVAELNVDPGPGTASSRSSFAVVLAQAAEQAIGR